TWGNNFTCNLCVPGLYIWFDTLTQKWGMVNKDPTNKASSATILYSNGIISNIETVKFTNTSLLTACKILYQNASGGFTVNSTFMKTGSPNKANCVSVVTADFDNDMDLDLLLSCQGQAVNYINKYYVNDGTGKFTNVTNFGAEGSLTGRSGGITYGDIDNDGFLDVLLENGEGQIGEYGEALHFNDGPTQLFRNNGNANHWIELELTSDISNSLAVGALVYCYSGGKKQLRLKGSETHCFAQSSQRIHFGLGKNALIDSLQIIWPNGADSVYYNIVPDQILAIHQSPETAPSRKSAVAQPEMLPISLYPNPTHNRLLIESKGYELGTFGVEIYDMSGNKVFENRQVTEREIPFEAYANGMYLVRIILTDGNEYLYKIIKQ
ncbi:MAG: FG-GAP-like repeat-containing protein, partial [Chitinophagales bacterium]|nr:FG-GAP-like repeat-containing protein [Chitinophagales bacterium]